MAKQDNFDFDTEGKGKFNLDFSFLKNLTAKQKETILMIAIAVVAVIVIVVVGVILMTANGGNGGNNGGGNAGSGLGDNSGEDGSEDGDNSGDDGNRGDVDLEADPTQIYIVTVPHKTTYYVNDPTPNYSGLVIGVIEQSSSGFKLSYDEYPEEFTITGFDTSEALAEQEITVEYKGYTTNFKIEIKEREVTPELVSIRVDPLPIKTVYTLDETIDLTGGRVICEYSDGTTRTLRFRDQGVSYSGFATITTLGEHEITVEYYDEFGGYAKTTFTITMVEATE